MNDPRRTILGVSIGHAANDTWWGVAPILLAALSTQMSLTNAEIGLIILFYEVLSALLQPFFGRLSERVGGRPLAVLSIIATTTMFSAALFAPTKFLLGLFIALAGLGSAAWHPQGAANATLAGGKRYGATAASIFFLGGTLGTAFLGAALGGYLLSTFGRQSLLLLAVITILLAITLVRAMVPRWMPVVEKASATNRVARSTAGLGFWALIGFLLISTALRSFTYFSLTTYIPKYQQDLGSSPAMYGILMSLFLVGEAVGGVGGSYLADRIGIRRILVGSMGLAAALLLVFLRLGGGWSYLFFLFTGLLIGPSHTLLVVAGQRQFPERIAMISGVFMGFSFISGSLLAWLLGLAADRVGLGLVLGVLPWALLGASLCALVAVPKAAPESESREQEAAAA